MSRETPYLDSRMAKVLPQEGEIITDLSKLTWTMGQVACAAEEIELPHFQYGFYGYQKVTESVIEDLPRGFFDYPDKMAETMPLFADRAFDALRRYVNGADDLGVWEPMLTDKRARDAQASIAMFDFLQFHVRCDLPKTLQDTQTEEKHHRDYKEKINMVLTDVGNQLLPKYVDVNPIFRKLRIPQLSLRFVLNELFTARDDAWNAFVELEQQKGNDSTILNIEQQMQQKATKRMLSRNLILTSPISKLVQTPKGEWDKEIPIAS